MGESLGAGDAGMVGDLCVGVPGLSGGPNVGDNTLKIDDDDDLERDIYGLGCGFGGSSIIGVEGAECCGSSL